MPRKRPKFRRSRRERQQRNENHLLIQLDKARKSCWRALLGVLTPLWALLVFLATCWWPKDKGSAGPPERKET